MDIGSYVIMGIILGICAIGIIILGVVQFRSKKPCNFYTGEKFDPKEISDIPAWNHRHGIMWILYGLLFPLLFVVELLIKNPLVFGFMFIGAVLVPLPFMVWYHPHLLKKYRVKK